jgi:putative MATE family efflux protein
MKLVTDKHFYKNILLLTVPLALQNLVTFTTNMLDTFMVGRADSTGVMISAINLANQPFFVLIMFIFGISGAGNVLASQYWGKQNIPAIKAIFAIVLKLAVGITAAFALAVLMFPRGVMNLYTKDGPTIAIGAEYLQIVGFSYLIYAVSATFIFSLRSVEVVRFSVVTQLATLFISAGLNYLLIFGNWGFPRLEHRGAAISTLTARTVELLLVLGFRFFIDKRFKFRPRDVLLWNKQLFMDLVRFGTPVVVNEVMWALGISVQAAILGHIAYAAGNPVAANTVAGIVQQFATIIMFGIANAAQVLIGKSVGEGDIVAVKRKSATFKLIALVTGLLACGVVLLLRGIVPYVYDFGAATNALTQELLLVTALSLIFVSLAATYIVGILRGTGDTKFCLIAEMAALWGFSLPLAALLAMVFHLPVPLVLLAMRSDEFLKAVVCTIRARGEKWVKAIARDGVGK